MASQKKRRKPSKDGLYLRGSIWWANIAGQRVSTKCKDREAARLYRARHEREQADPAAAAQRKATLGMMINDTIEAAKGRGRSAATIEIYEIKLGWFARCWGEKLPLSEITYERVGKYLEWRRDTKGVGPHTLHKELRHLRTLLQRAQRRGLFTGDVAFITRSRDFSPQYKPRARHLDWEHIPKLLAALEHSPGLAKTAQAPDRARHVAWILATAARWVESERAQAEDHDLERWTVALRGSKTEAARATIPIAPPFRPLLAYALQGAVGGRPLFRKWGNVNRSLVRACVRAGVPRVSPNDLRRTNSTLLSRAGVPNHVLFKLLRHTTERMVNAVYNSQTVESLGQEVSKLKAGPGAKLLPPAKKGW